MSSARRAPPIEDHPPTMNRDVVMEPADGHEVGVLVAAAERSRADVVHLEPIAGRATLDRAPMLVPMEDPPTLLRSHRANRGARDCSDDFLHSPDALGMLRLTDRGNEPIDLRGVLGPVDRDNRSSLAAFADGGEGVSPELTGGDPLVGRDTLRQSVHLGVEGGCHNGTLGGIEPTVDPVVALIERRLDGEVAIDRCHRAPATNELPDSGNLQSVEIGGVETS